MSEDIVHLLQAAIGHNDSLLITGFNTT